MNLFWKIQCAFGPIYIVRNGQILSKHSRHLVTLVRTMFFTLGLLLSLLLVAVVPTSNESRKPTVPRCLRSIIFYSFLFDFLQLEFFITFYFDFPTTCGGNLCPPPPPPIILSRYFLSANLDEPNDVEDDDDVVGRLGMRL